MVDGGQTKLDRPVTIFIIAGGVLFEEETVVIKLGWENTKTSSPHAVLIFANN